MINEHGSFGDALKTGSAGRDDPRSAEPSGVTIEVQLSRRVLAAVDACVAAADKNGKVTTRAEALHAFAVCGLGTMHFMNSLYEIGKGEIGKGEHNTVKPA